MDEPELEGTGPLASGPSLSPGTRPGSGECGPFWLESGRGVGGVRSVIGPFFDIYEVQ